MARRARGVAEAGHPTSPVGLAGEGGPRRCGHRLAPLHEARAQAARCDFLLDGVQRVRSGPVRSHGAEPTMVARARIRSPLTVALQAPGPRIDPDPARSPRRHPDHRQDAAGTGRRPPPGGEGPDPGRRGGRPDRRHGEAPDGDLRLAPRADPGDGRPHRLGTRPAGTHGAGTHRGRRGRLDGEVPGQAVQDEGVADRPTVAERVPVPRRRVVHRNVGS